MRYLKEGLISGRSPRIHYLFIYSQVASLGIVVVLLCISVAIPFLKYRKSLFSQYPVAGYGDRPLCAGDVLFVSKFKSGEIREKVVAFGSERSILYHYLPLVLITKIDSSTDLSLAGNHSGARAAKGGYVFNLPNHTLRYILYRLRVLDSVVLPVSFLKVLGDSDDDNIAILKLYDIGLTLDNANYSVKKPHRMLLKQSSELLSFVGEHYPDFSFDREGTCE